MERVTEVDSGIHQLVSYRDNFAGLPGSNVFYVVGDNGAVFIDTGYDHEGDHGMRVQLWRDTGSPELLQIIAMHRHADHAGGAATLSQATGAPIACHPEDRSSIEEEQLKGRADVSKLFTGGESIDLGNMTIEISHAPGHTPGSLAVFIPERGALFTTDTVLANSTTAIGDQGDMAEYVRTLGEFQEFDSRVIYPGHGGPITDTSNWLAYLLKHRQEREEQLLTEITGGRNTIEALGTFLYPKLTSPRTQAMGQTQVRTMLRKLASEGKVTQAEDGTITVAR
jgi:glyoxylase-like metal-dependent hydrolase (beta-lactamase superfamily II)